MPKNNSNSKYNFRINLRVLNKLIFILNIFCSIFYVTIINDLSIKGFVIKELKQQGENLKSNNQDLSLKITYLKSYHSLDEKIKNAGFIAEGDIEYIDLPQEILAMK